MEDKGLKIILHASAFFCAMFSANLILFIYQ